jgi:adenylate cyclase
VLAVYTVATAVVLLITDREKQFVRRAFGQYLAPAMVERLAEDPNALALGGETREITIHFCDIRGFTSLSEGLDPQDLTRLLNDFLTPMTDVLLKSGATIDKYIGDSIMCFWNAPLPLPNHGRAACLATLEMVRELEKLNQRGNKNLKLGIGLNSGVCCVGNLGSHQRFSYSAIGDAVNVASRVEGLTKQYGVSILVTETTAAQAADLALLEVDLVRVVGRTRPIAVHALLGDAAHAASAEFQTLRDAHKVFLGAYRARRFDSASDALANAASHAPAGLRHLYELYVERLATLRADPPGEGWDGAFTAREK